MGKNKSSFAELLDAARSGSESARQQIFVDVKNYLLLISNQELDENLRRKLGPSDVVQQTYVNAVSELNNFRGTTAPEFRGWIRTILLREIGRVRGVFRCLKRDIGREENLYRNDSQAGIVHHGVDAELTPASSAIEAEKLATLEAAMNRLAPNHQLVIKMRNLDRMKFALIAKKMNRSEDAVRKLWQRAILQLNGQMHVGTNQAKKV